MIVSKMFIAIKTDGNKDENTDMSRSTKLVILICTYIVHIQPGIPLLVDQ